MSNAPIDPATIDELKATTGEFVREIIETFLGEAPAMVASI